MNTATVHAGDRIIIGNRSVSRDDTMAALGNHLNSIPEKVHDLRRVPLGMYRGLRFGLILHPQFAPELYLEGAATLRDTLSREHHGPRAILNALDRVAGSYRSSCDSVRKDLTIAECPASRLPGAVGKPFMP